MLSIQRNAYHSLMAADEYAESRDNLYNYVKSPTAISTADKTQLHPDAIANARCEPDDSGDDDEISVGCPSPIPSKGDKTQAGPPSSSSESSIPFAYTMCKSSEKSDENHTSDVESFRRFSSSDEDVQDEPEEYFKPLKRLKMMKIDKTSYSISERSKSNHNKRVHRHSSRHHHHKVSNTIRPPHTEENVSDDGCTPAPGVKSFSICDILSHKPSRGSPSSSKIVRPWDCEPQEQPANPYLVPPPAHRGILSQPPLFFSQFHPQQIALHLRSVKSEDVSSAYESCSSSGRSSTGGSDCCTSPDVLNCSVRNQSTTTASHHPRHRSRSAAEHTSRGKNANGKSANSSSPLDALFNLTNKTFDELNGDANPENGSHLNLFNNRQQTKKKRKSRTAFTNTQIFELERRFIYQKYLSPADRDEIAGKLGLSNAQVITWFQNRRAKLKRDLEEAKKDVESSKVLSVHNTFLENVQNFGMLKKKPVSHSEYKHQHHEGDK